MSGLRFSHPFRSGLMPCCSHREFFYVRFARGGDESGSPTALRRPDASGKASWNPPDRKRQARGWPLRRGARIGRRAGGRAAAGNRAASGGATKGAGERGKTLSRFRIVFRHRKVRRKRCSPNPSLGDGRTGSQLAAHAPGRAGRRLRKLRLARLPRTRLRFEERKAGFAR